MAITKSGVGFLISLLIMLTFMISRFYYIRSNELEIKKALQKAEKQVASDTKHQVEQDFEFKLSEELSEKSSLSEKLKHCERESKKQHTQCLNDKTAELNELKSELESKLDICQKDSKDNHDLEIRLETCHENVAKLNKHKMENVSQIKSKDEEIQKLETDNNAKQQKVQELTASLDKLAAENHQLKTQPPVAPVTKAPTPSVNQQNNDQEINNLKQEYETRIHNLKAHYEFQLKQANQKIQELFEDRQNKINKLNNKMVELKSHLESYTNEFMSEKLEANDFGLSFDDYNQAGYSK